MPRPRLHHVQPVIGISPDREGDRVQCAVGYGRAVREAGGTPFLLDHEAEHIPAYLELCDGFVLTGGDDPAMEVPWGITTHPQARPIHPERQRFELALLTALEDWPTIPLLGICLGMQLMSLHAGGELDQYLPESTPTAGDHWGKKPHRITGELGEGVVLSHHRQAMRTAGRMKVIARAHDEVIEAVRDPDRAFSLGVQWHPERTEEPRFGQHLFDRFVEAARAAKGAESRRTSRQGA